jgi:hypothetical protein
MGSWIHHPPPPTLDSVNATASTSTSPDVRNGIVPSIRLSDVFPHILEVPHLERNKQANDDVAHE